MYTNCIFDLYGTLVDIRTDENKAVVWEKLSMFYGYYGAAYTPSKLKAAYEKLVKDVLPEAAAENGAAHEAFPELKLENVFQVLFENKGICADLRLAVCAGQFFRILSTDIFVFMKERKKCLRHLRPQGKSSICCPMPSGFLQNTR